MSVTINSRTVARHGTRVAVTLSGVVAVLVAVPAALVGLARLRFDHASPLHGMNAPWRWSIDDVQSWGHRLTTGFESSASMVDVVIRIALVLAWACFAVVVFTVVDEVVFQLRHGMPSARRRRLVGLSPFARRVATLLITILPLAATATPTLAIGSPTRAPIDVTAPRVGDIPVRTATTVPMSGVARAVAEPTATGWSLVEVKRGDSIWSIAERVAAGRDIADTAHQIIDANLGAVMTDGQRFATPALIEPGWVLNVPDAGSGPAPSSVTAAAIRATGDYTVVAGDSYWGIAEHHLDSARNSDVAAYSAELMELNAPELGYGDPRLIHPGDVIHLDAKPDALEDRLPSAPVSPIAEPTPAVEETPAVPSTAVVETPPPALVAPPVPAATSTPLELPDTVSENPSPVPSADYRAFLKSLSSNDIPVKNGLGAALMLAGGAVVALESRRRQRLRAARVGDRLEPPTAKEIETETELRTLTPGDQLARLDLSLRSTASFLARQNVRALAVEIAIDGEVRLHTDRPAMIAAPHWDVDEPGRVWSLSRHVSLGDLAPQARESAQPCPAIVHIGASTFGELFVDLEAVGLLGIDAPPAIAASIVRCLAASLAVSPFAESSRVFTVGLEVDTDLGNPCVESHRSLEAAVDAVTSNVGSITTATAGGVTTFALRAAARGGEAWEPSILLAVGDADRSGLVAVAAGGGRGVGVVVDAVVFGSGAELHLDGGEFVLEPLGIRVVPAGLSADEVAAVAELLDTAESLVTTTADEVVEFPLRRVTDYVDRAHEFVVQLLGPIAVEAVDGRPVNFDRSKAQELVVWLSQHRRRPTRTAARTALWDLAVRDATFSNVVSDARRAMAKVVAPPAAHEWIGRTMNEELPLHELVVSDAELLADRVSAARGLRTSDAIGVLRPGVAMIEGLPFSGTAYLWPDAEGITSSLVLLATSAAAELAEHYLSVGDIDGVFWSTGQGLKVLAGHEELIALRMRAHATRGDLAGVRGEWDSYERAVQADTWAALEPSPKLIQLRRELLTPSLAS
jgi:nucleoid-associated protein YgaU/two-component SAPR family response regulator